MSAVRDPYLALPLTGVQAIEASAGTGKTFTLATLVVRLVVERGLRISDILAVTFTEAATQELRARIRARLLLAAALSGETPGEGSVEASPEATLTRALLEAHLAHGGESRAALQRRLRDAADGIDLASVFTIHGFCARVLREHALESGHGFDAPTLLTNDLPLRKEIATDLWRAHGADAAGAEDLLALWKGGPDALAGDLSQLLREPLLLPRTATLPPDPSSAREAAADVLVEAIDRDIDDAKAVIAEAFDRKILHGTKVKRPSFEKAFAELSAGRDARMWVRGKDSHLDKLLPEKLLSFCYEDKREHVPVSPLFDALNKWFDAESEVRNYLALRCTDLLHRLRDDARLRLAARKQQLRVQTYDDLIDGVANALEGPHGDVLAQRLRTQYQVALVDEFQDTDARQWRIFDRVFGSGSHDPALFLIGDPKQAIYGFRGGDVETYLQAKASAVEAPPLSHNFRSRPSVLAAIEALYTQADDAAFVDDRIRFHAVQPGGTRSDHDHLRDDEPAPAITLWRAPPSGAVDSKGNPKLHSAPRSRELAAQACVTAIHRVLTEARDGQALLDGKPVQPGDIAVLVRTHHEATRIRQALAEAGIPAVAAGKLSLFATPEAREVHALLIALAHGADDGRLRTALATLLLGVDAAGIAALDIDDIGMQDRQQHAQDWRERLQQGGPLALINDLCAEHAARLLGLLDGERRLTNYLQLAEMLQEQWVRSLGLPGLVDWLAEAIAGADRGADDDAQLLRLESDARRVQIVTLHKSKGLEYPLVFLPFAGIGSKPRDPGSRVVVTGAEGRSLHWKLQADTSGWAEAREAWSRAQKAEDARLLYVGLTRAEHALWIATGPFHGHTGSPLAPLLGDAAALKNAPANIIIDDTPAPAPASLPWLRQEGDAGVAPARIATRHLSPDWWVYSFTQLAHADAGQPTDAAALDDSGAARDEPAQVEPGTEAIDGLVGDGNIDVFDPRFSGSRFGNVLHDALEKTDFAAWADWRTGQAAPEGQDDVLRAALGREGYADDTLDDGIALLASLVGRTLTAPLPEGGALHAVPVQDRRAEIEFHFAMRPTTVSALIDLLHTHGVARERRGFGLRRRLEGLMTGKIDLTYTQDARWYVLDYKSNRLPGYDAAQLAAAMMHSEYDLQALIYTVALHRWLRFRLGDGYDYTRDFGGIRYLFCRGLDPDSPASPGVFAHRFAPALVQALDALFAGRAEGAAA